MKILADFSRREMRMAKRTKMRLRKRKKRANTRLKRIMFFLVNQS
jgi:hypothetical protein